MNLVSPMNLCEFPVVLDLVNPAILINTMVLRFNRETVIVLLVLSTCTV
jgi:hypothetical protein